MEVICHNKGYEWTCRNDIYFRGYVQDENGEVYRNISACRLFQDVDKISELVQLLENLSGCFALIIVKESKTLAAVDIARSMPLYYDSDAMYISDSAEEIIKRKNISRECANSLRLLELYSTSFVAYGNTAYDSIRQLKLGTVAEFSKFHIIEKYYFRHIPDVIRKISRNDAIKQLKKVTEEVLINTLKVINGRQIVLSLSGGYDSRYIACSLKKLGVEKVICYAYGKHNSFEVIQSKTVADALGYEWYFIEYTEEKVKNLLNETDYIEYCKSLDYSLYIQNYIAVKELVELNAAEPDAVFITGLCNDMPSGSYIPEESFILGRYALTNQGLAQYIVDTRFIRTKLKAQTRQKFIEETIGYLEEQNISVSSYQEFVSANDCVTTFFDHSMCYLNMNKPHEYFGHEWLLPCWDKKNLEFWYSLPAEYRIHQNLYEEYIINELAGEFGVGQKKKKSRNYNYGVLSIIRRSAGGIAAAVLYSFGIPFRRTGDFNNFAALECGLYKRIKQKNSVDFKRASITMLMNIYMLEQNFGDKWFYQVKKLKAGRIEN